MYVYFESNAIQDKEAFLFAYITIFFINVCMCPAVLHVGAVPFCVDFNPM